MHVSGIERLVQFRGAQSGLANCVNFQPQWWSKVNITFRSPVKNLLIIRIDDDRALDPNDNETVYEFTVSAFAVTLHNGTTKLPVNMIYHEIDMFLLLPYSNQLLYNIFL